MQNPVVGYVVASVLMIFAVNFAADRIGSATAKRLIFVLSAALPFIVTAAFTAQGVYRDGLSATFHDGYLYLLWLVTVIGALATTATALLRRSVSSGTTASLSGEPRAIRVGVISIAVVGACIVVFAAWLASRQFLFLSLAQH